MQALQLIQSGDVAGVKEFIESNGRIVNIDLEVRALSAGAGLLHWVTEVAEADGGQELLLYIVDRVMSALKGEGGAEAELELSEHRKQSLMKVIWAADDSGALATHWAALSNAVYVIKVLLSPGPVLQLYETLQKQNNQLAVDAVDDFNETALHYASLHGARELAKELLAMGASVNLRNDDGSTALHLAAMNRRKEVLALLLDSGANVSVQNHKDETAENIAAAAKDEELLGVFNAEKRAHAEALKKLTDANVSLEARLAEQMDINKGLQNKLAAVFHDLAKAEAEVKLSKATDTNWEEEARESQAEVVTLREETEQQRQKIQTLEVLFQTAMQQNQANDGKLKLLEQERVQSAGLLQVAEKELDIKSRTIEQLEEKFTLLQARFDSCETSGMDGQPSAVVVAKKAVESGQEESTRLRMEYQQGLFKQLRATMANLQTLTSLTDAALRDTNKQLDLVLDDGSPL